MNTDNGGTQQKYSYKYYAVFLAFCVMNATTLVLNIGLEV